MREILFRAKPCYMGGNKPTWVYGTFQYIAQRRIRLNATDNGTLEPRTDKGRIVDLYGIETEVLCDTLGQFTGLVDKNGVKIFEGDIVRIYDSDNEEYSDQQVKFAHGVFGVDNWTEKILTTLSFFLTGGDSEYSVEVIGNIHDDPKLIGCK